MLEPRTAFEYSSSVHTADYTNHASVKHDSAGLAVAHAVIPAAAAAPIEIVKSVPIAHHVISPAPVHETLIEAAPPVLVESEPSAVAVVKEIAAAEPVAIEHPVVHAAEPIVEVIKPQLQYTRQYQEPATFVQVPAHYISSPAIYHVAEPIVQAIPAASIDIHQPGKSNADMFLNTHMSFA